MNKDLLIQEVKETFDGFMATVAKFDAATYNKVPFENSWTAGQVVQHIVLASQGFVQVLNGETKDTDRPFDQQIPVIKEIFLNFNSKLKSPDFILPEARDYDKDAHLALLDKINTAMMEAIPSLQLDQLCLGMELPNMGHLTRFEAIYFVIYHAQRHHHQLKNIAAFLKVS
ncbi:MAG: DinB family protein [Pedobacter sp.]|nr:DinB family protein [Pedobacter sp.]MDQ8053233.1 DinB family protein [Pedobacter sp.]